MHILIAPNAFKHSLDAPTAARAIEAGFLASKLDCRCTCFPIGDGGNGTGDLIVHHLNGERIRVDVQDPLGRPAQASFGLVNGGKSAVVEMAAASGLHLLSSQELNPLLATSYGTGQLIRAALGHGIEQLILAIGGSATVDGGTGILRALGIRFLDRDDRAIETPEQLTNLTHIDLTGLDPRLTRLDIRILCDVDNPLVGPTGAAAVFGPQKGATPDMVRQLDAGLSRLAESVQATTGIDIAGLKHGGAAGGVSASLHALSGAQLVNGIDFFLTFTGFGQHLATADLVVTGEGSLDEQTLHGKGPFGVAQAAKGRGLPVIGLAGRVPARASEALEAWFDTLLAIGHEPTDLAAAFAHTEENLSRTARQLGNLLAYRNTNAFR
ncbi:glycerate kinase [Arsenicibacter rosenii]|uniref:Glycerate kinase n=1 Tax=Arsenicibacter rosenii TaxID=1750698 RepID=A0A1S2VPM7_9BACT|nr:glycerate kinase [Arsenicibacter rosenii]OIN60704.1 glycerate kinase [Arsenicibacter rosenii]